MTISARIGKYNCVDGVTQQAPLTLSLENEAPDPIISGIVDNSYCLPFGTDSVTFTVSNASPEVDYNWDLRSWRILSQNENGSSITFKPENNEQTIRLNISGGCSEKTYIYDINRSLRSDYVIKNDYKTNNCLPANTVQRFYVDQVPQGTEMLWTVSGAGWSISEDESRVATPQITVGTGVGVVSASCGKCASTVIADTFYIAPAMLGEITGETCLDYGDTTSLTYSVSAVSNADYYEWSYPSQWAVSGSANNNSITLIPDGVHADTVKVRAVGCGETDWSKLSVKMAFAAPQGITIEDCINVGRYGFACISVNEDASSSGELSYEWDIPDGFGSILPSYSNQQRIRVRTLGNAGDYHIRVQVQNSCGSNAVLDSTVTVAYRTSMDVGEIYANWYHFGVVGAPQDAQITWQIDGVAESKYDNTSDIVLNGDVFSDNSIVTATIKYTDGCYDVHRVYVSDYVSRNKSMRMGSNSSTGDLKIYPNPASSLINVALPEDDEYVVLVYNLSGSLLLDVAGNGRFCKVDATSLPKGEYICCIHQSGKVYGTKVIISK